MKENVSRVWRLTPVISAGEVKIKRIEVQSHPKQKFSKTLSQQISLVLWCKPVVPDMCQVQIRESRSQACWSKTKPETLARK
jgi:hypothetical protein